MQEYRHPVPLAEDVYRTNEECKIAMASPVAPPTANCPFCKYDRVRTDLCGPVAATGEALFQLCIKAKLRRRLSK